MYELGVEVDFGAPVESLRVHSSQLAAKELPNFAFQTSQLAAEKID
jgi:hypothetical protein